MSHKLPKTRPRKISDEIYPVHGAGCRVRPKARAFENIEIGMMLKTELVEPAETKLGSVRGVGPNQDESLLSLSIRGGQTM